VTKHRWIRTHVTLREAVLYAAELVRMERIAEYRRQQLYQVINGSLGGDFKADESLLEAPSKASSRAPTGRQQLRNWIQLADIMGADVPASVRELANER
jgi:hypothetical protein